MRKGIITVALVLAAGLPAAAVPAGATGCDPGFMIGGTVTDATTGLPLAQTTSVGIEQLDGDFADGEGTVLPSSTWSACVPPGTYRIGFFADDYFLQWFDGAPTAELATAVPVAADVGGLDGALFPLECNGLAPTILGTVGDDIIIGTAGDDIIQARAGNDLVFGGDGDDVLCGAIGDDELRGGNGADLLIGGYGDDEQRGNAGTDTVDYRDAPGPVTVNLGTRSASGHGADTIFSTVNVIGSPFADRLFGNALANDIRGGAGDDSLNGKGGDDLLFGEGGDDLLNGRGGDDLYHGGPGSDRGTWIQSPTGVVVDLIGGLAAGDGADTLVAIEELRGSRHGDTLLGNGAANVLIGGRGDDLLVGRVGDDVLIGNRGTDEARGGAGTDTCRAETEIGCEA